MSDETADRIDRLEMRLTEQQAVLDDLDATMTAQWRTIDALKRQVARLTEQVEDAAHRAATGGAEPPPPHY